MMERYGVIYLIINKVNNKIYVGQTVKDFKSRYRGNIVKNTHNEHLKSSILKYGIDNFEIIEEYKEAYSKEELDYLEGYYINLFDSTDPQKGYNKMTGGLVNNVHSIETIKKISNTQKEKYKNGYMHPNKGRTTPESTRNKISNTHKIRGVSKGAKNPKSRKVVQLSKEGEFIKTWEYIGQALPYFTESRDPSTISAVCRGRNKSAYGYKWAYYEDYIKEHPEILETV